MDSTNNYMNQDDLWRVMDGIPKLKIRKWDDYDIMMLFKILYWCALRPIEGINLEKSNISINNRTITLPKTKTGKNQSALIPNRFVDELTIFMDSKEEDGRLFEGLTYHPFYVWCKRLGVEYEIEAWTTPQSVTGEKTVGHLFRKSIGKEMLQGEVKTDDGKNFSVPIISKHLRHKKPSVTFDHYLKASISQVREIF